jgi:2-polyprenyl-3-methyl-5-hydroxy-6-metoxy-1,4-benzoquinol methylase
MSGPSPPLYRCVLDQYDWRLIGKQFTEQILCCIFMGQGVNVSQPQSDFKHTAAYWSAEGSWQKGRGLFWMELDAVQRRLNVKASGSPDIDWVTYTLQTHLANRMPVDNCLSLGCGQGNLERQLARSGAFRSCDANDIATGSIHIAQARAATEGFEQIHYQVEDLNQIILPVQYYDVVFAAGAIHHVTNLEHLLEQVGHTLRPGGLLVLNEYVGPSRFQFPARQRALINACHTLLPNVLLSINALAVERDTAPLQRFGWQWYIRKAIDKTLDGDLLGAFQRWHQRRRAAKTGTLALKTSPNLPTARSVTALDPSEAVRSGEIRSLLETHFEIIDYKPLGGTILQFLLADIAGNFQTPDGQIWLDLLFSIEDTLMASSEINSDFGYFVATPRLATA